MVRRRGNLTGRAAVLALVVCGLMLALAYPVRQFVAQRSHIAELRDHTAAQEQRVAGLERQLARWEDPAYVRAQARERLQYVMPGEVQYVVLEPEEAPAPGGPTDAPAAPGAVVVTPPPADEAWYATLWRSVQGADSPPADSPPVDPSPAPSSR